MARVLKVMNVQDPVWHFICSSYKIRFWRFGLENKLEQNPVISDPIRPICVSADCTVTTQQTQVKDEFTIILS